MPGETSNGGVTGAPRSSIGIVQPLATVLLAPGALSVGIDPLGPALQPLGFQAVFVGFLRALSGFEFCLIRLLRTYARLFPLARRLLPALLFPGPLAPE